MPSIIDAGGAAPATMALHRPVDARASAPAGALISVRRARSARRSSGSRGARGSASKIGFALDPAQAHVGAGHCRQRPREAPAVAVEHRQRPQVDRMARHAPREHVADRVQVRAAVVVRPRPWGCRWCPTCSSARSRPTRRRAARQANVGIALGEKRLVVDRADPLARAGVLGVVDVDHQERLRAAQRRAPPSRPARTRGRRSAPSPRHGPA